MLGYFIVIFYISVGLLITWRDGTERYLRE